MLLPLRPIAGPGGHQDRLATRSRPPTGSRARWLRAEDLVLGRECDGSLVTGPRFSADAGARRHAGDPCGANWRWGRPTPAPVPAVGAMRCWGSGTKGQLGDGTRVPVATPTVAVDGGDWLWTDIAVAAKPLLRRPGDAPCGAGATTHRAARRRHRESPGHRLVPRGHRHLAKRHGPEPHHVWDQVGRSLWCWGYTAPMDNTGDVQMTAPEDRDERLVRGLVGQRAHMRDPQRRDSLVLGRQQPWPVRRRDGSESRRPGLRWGRVATGPRCQPVLATRAG